MFTRPSNPQKNKKCKVEEKQEKKIKIEEKKSNELELDKNNKVNEEFSTEKSKNLNTETLEIVESDPIKNGTQSKKSRSRSPSPIPMISNEALNALKTEFKRNQP